MSFCRNCNRQTAFTISCPLNGKITCAKCHDVLCPRFNPVPIIDLGKRTVSFSGVVQ